VTFTDYTEIKAVNWSTAKHMDRSALHYRHAVDSGVTVTETDPMRLGRALHTLIFEPAKFTEQYTVWEAARNSNAWKAFAVENAHLTILTASQHERAHAMAAAIFAHPVARELVTTPGPSEHTLTWIDAATGLRCKCRLDKLAGRTLVDLKSYADLSPRSVESNTHKMGYPCQLAHYRNGAVANGLMSPDDPCMIIGVESKAPFDVGVFMLDTESLTVGAAKVAELLGRIKECHDTGKWPGRYPELQAYQLPEWARQAPELTYEEEE
jgi:hypothetical protein